VKLAFVVQRYGSDFIGGAEKYGRAMATGLAAEGHDITVVTSCATSYADWANVYPPGTADDEGVTVHRVPVVAPRDNDRFIPLHLRATDTWEVPLWPWAQERWAQTMGPDLVAALPLLAEVAAAADVTVFLGYHYAHTLLLTRHVAAFGATVVIPTAHPEGAFHVGRVGHIFQHADRVLCLAPEEAELVGATYGCGDKIDVVPCPVQPLDPPLAANIAPVLEPLGLRRDRYAVVVGRVDPAKGSDDAMRFAREYHRSVDPTFELVVVGPGGDELSEGDGIRTTGFVADPVKDALVAGAGVLVQPSYMESFSLALMEAWMFERPALIQRRSRVLAGHTTRSGGGLTYRDYLDFEAALHTLLTSPDLRHTLGTKGHNYALREFAWGRVAPQFLAAMAAGATAGAHRLEGQRSLVR